MSLKRDRRGHVILRFRSGGRGSKYEYHDLGAITPEEVKDRENIVRNESSRRAGCANPFITFSDLAKTWMERRPEKMNENCGGTLRLHILPVLGPLRVAQLSPAAIEDYRSRRLVEKNPPMSSSLNLERSLIIQILNFGEASQIVRNPIPRGSVKPLVTREDPSRIEVRTKRFLAERGFTVHRKGHPDLMIECRDPLGNPVAVLLELKDRGDHLRPEQRAFLGFVGRWMPVIAGVARTPEEAFALLLNHGLSPSGGEAAETT